ncbi:adenylate kinase isoenzyme 1-like [Lynx pardinus]|uniref:Adenylate kinase isoenzyme 1-like n=1 Tax=Lynx pardinus TaxID=191816 RepID=A0A485NIN7_LYNPA|nr:adenylate kinase isoenzyme 1-like [Lynx pardinus]
MPDILKSALTVFVMGGPGCGKGTQCKNVATKYGFCHVGLGQPLPQEGQCSTQRGGETRDVMLQGLLLHRGRGKEEGIITDLISNTMLSCQESWAFLTDGFPWKLKQAKELERIVGRAPDLIMFDCSMDAMVCRVWHRGQKEHRVCDCESALREGLETYDTLCEPVLTSYRQNNLLRNVDLGRSSSRRHFAQCCSVTERLQ